jgi:hypothetical protein
MGLHKVQLVLDLAKLGVDALTVDADAFILRDAWQYIRRYPRADVLMSSDLLRATRGYNHTGLEDASGFGVCAPRPQRCGLACYRGSAWRWQRVEVAARGGRQEAAQVGAELAPCSLSPCV